MYAGSSIIGQGSLRLGVEKLLLLRLFWKAAASRSFDQLRVPRLRPAASKVALQTLLFFSGFEIYFCYISIPFRL